MLVSTYIVERSLILEPCEVDAKTNEGSRDASTKQRKSLLHKFFDF